MKPRITINGIVLLLLFLIFSNPLLAQGEFSLTSPGNTLTGVSVLPTFEFDDDTLGAPYTIEVLANSNDFDGGSPITITTGNGTGVGTFSYSTLDTNSGFPLDNETLYYWRVTHPAPDTSDTSSFTTTADLSLTLSYPSDGFVVYDPDPLTLYWFTGTAVGTTKFALQVIDSSKYGGAYPTPVEWDTAALVVDTSGIGTTSAEVTVLFGGKEYVWRVIAYDEDGTTTGYQPAEDKTLKISGMSKFTTSGGAVTAYPSYPAGGLTIYDKEPTLYWYTLVYESMATFEVLVATSDNTTDGVLDTDLLAGSPYSPAASTDYFVTVDSAHTSYSTMNYWQVRTIYYTDTVYSAIDSFYIFEDGSVIPQTPTLIYPVGGVSIYTTAPTFYWYTGFYSTEITYTVEVDTQVTFATAVSDDTTGSSLTIPGLAAGKKHYWRVTASNAPYPSAVSVIDSFYIVGGSTASVVPSYPTGGLTVYTTTPLLSWYLVGSSVGWDHFEVRWDSTYPGDWTTSTFVYSTTDMYTFSHTVSPALEEGKKYYWSVGLHDGSTAPGDADFEAVEDSFMVYGGASSVTVVQSLPIDGSSNVSTSPTLSWYVLGAATIDSFSVKYSPYLDPELDPSPGDTSGFTGTSVMLSGLSSGTTYSWKVTAHISSETVETEYYTFTTSPTAMAVQPIGGSPINNVSIAGESATLSWFLPVTPLANQTHQVEISKDLSFNDATIISGVTGNQVNIDGLSTGQHYWRVKGVNSSGSSYYSSPQSFRVGAGVTSADDDLIPRVFKVSQNYPNPFNPTTQINFSVPNTDIVTIKIYNIMGQEVRALVNKEFTPGNYKVTWNGTNNTGVKVSSGAYIYRVVSGEKIITKKMVLLK